MNTISVPVASSADGCVNQIWDQVGRGFDIRSWFAGPCHGQAECTDTTTLRGLKFQFAYHDLDEDDVTITSLHRASFVTGETDTQTIGTLQSNLATSVSVGVGSLDLGHGLAAGSDYTSDIQQAYQSNKRVRIDWSQVPITRVELKPGSDLDPLVRSGLARLLRDDSQDGFNAFFENYGTHIVVAADFGGRVSVKTTYENSQCISNETRCASAYLGGAYKAFVGAGEVDHCVAHDQVEIILSAKREWDVWGGERQRVFDMIAAF
jgi:hypothetical protein